MQLGRFFQIGLKHAANSAAEALYLNAGIDRTKPIAFHALINERCNARCRHCEYWRLPDYSEELSIKQWQDALLSIKKFAGSFAINFSGGEPLLKKGFMQLLTFCNEHGILAGATTNGSLLTLKNARRIVATRPLNVNISVDAPNADIHDYFRGVPGLFEKLYAGIQFLIYEQKTQQVSFPIIIKPTITSLNFRQLPDLVQWVQKSGATAVNFQPLGRWTPETYDELWINEESWPDLDQVIDQLIEMKRSGAPIMNSEENLKLTTANFREKKAEPQHMPCRVGLQEFYIRPNGDVCLCFHFPPIGNIAEQSAQEIWRGDKGAKIRKATTQCSKLCLATCHSHKSLFNKAGQALKIFSSKSLGKPLVLGENR